jgi:hypothetical protein
LEYYVGGFKALRSRIDLDDKQTLLAAVGKWRVGFSKMIDEQKNELLLRPASAETDIAIKFAIKSWLVMSTEFFGLMFETFAKKPEYRSRSELIIFGIKNTKVVGKCGCRTSDLYPILRLWTLTKPPWPIKFFREKSSRHILRPKKKQKRKARIGDDRSIVPSTATKPTNARSW